MIDELTMKSFLKDLEYLVNIDSCQDSPEGLTQVAEFFEKEFKKMGWKTSLVDVGAPGPCFVAVNREAETYDWYFSGHMDTVFPKGTVKERPFSVVHDDGKNIDIAKGPGVCDMKHGLLTTLYAIRALGKEADKFNIVVAFQPDEEIGSPYARDLLCKIGAKSKVCLIMEAGEDDDKVIHCIQRKGMIKFKFEFTGKAGHAGSMLTNGSVSAITEMNYWITQILTLINREKATTANIGLVSGGTGSNVVAGYAEMTGEIRFERLDEAEKAKALIASLYEHAEKAGVKVERPLDRFEKPMVPSEETVKFVEFLQKLSAEDGGEFVVRKRGGLSAGNFISAYVPVCVDGMGPAGNKAHAVDEYLRLDTLKEDIEFIMKILKH